MTREEAIDVLRHNYPSACFEDLCEAVEIAIQALSAQPTVDAVEVIRCKDCNYGRECDMNGYRLCSAMTNPNYVSCEHFCGSGGRKEE